MSLDSILRGLAKSAGLSFERGKGPGVQEIPAERIKPPRDSRPGDTWMGPGTSLTPRLPPGSPGRALDYRTLYNTAVQPGRDEGISFPDLRALANDTTLAQQIMTSISSEILTMEWGFRLKQQEGESRADTLKRGMEDKRIAQLVDLWEYPGRSGPALADLVEPEADFGSFASKVLDDLMVIDAVAIEPRKTNGGDPYAFDYIDPATITLKINEDGRRPSPDSPPDPKTSKPTNIAFQQIIKGIPNVDFTSRELLYFRRMVRSYKFYGFSPIEKLQMTLNILGRHALDWLNFYTTGNVPLGFINGADGWTPDQLKQYQEWMDEYNTLEKRAGINWIPAGAKYQAAKIEFARRIEEAEWLAREICAQFGRAPSAYIRMMNRATAQQGAEEEDDQAIVPWAQALARVVNTCTRAAFGPQFRDLEFYFKDQVEPDQATQVAIDKDQIGFGGVQVDEWRVENGKEPLGLPPGYPTQTGYILFPVKENADALAAQQAAKASAFGAKKPDGEDPNAKPGVKKFSVYRGEREWNLEHRIRALEKSGTLPRDSADNRAAR